MTQNEFKRQQEAAVQRMKEMNARSQSKKENSSDEAKPNHQSQNSPLSLPFLSNLLGDGDSSLIIGLLLILMSEKADKLLLFALIYILI